MPDTLFDSSQDIITQRETLRKARSEFYTAARKEVGQDFTPFDRSEVEKDVDSVYPLSEQQRKIEQMIHAGKRYDPGMDENTGLVPDAIGKFAYATGADVAGNVVVGATRITKFYLNYTPQGLITQYMGGVDPEKFEKMKDSYLLHYAQPVQEQQEGQGYRHWTGWAGLGGNIAAPVLATVATGGLGAAAGLPAAANALLSATGATLVGHFALERETEDLLSHQKDENGKLMFSPGEAKSRAILVSTATLPVSIFLNSHFFPTVQAFGGKEFGDQIFGAAIDGAVNNTINAGLTGAVTRPAQYFAGVDRTLGETVGAIFDDMKSGFAIGGVIGAGHGAIGKLKPEELRQNMSDLYHVDMDVYSPRDFKRKLMTEFDQTGAYADAHVELVDGILKRAVALNYFPSVQDAWGGIFARHSEEANLNLGGDILFQNRSKVAEFYSKLRNEVMNLQPKGKFSADQLAATFQNKGVKLDELEWTGMAKILEGAKKDGVSFSRSELAAFLDKNEVKLDVVKKTESQAGIELKKQQLFRAFEESEKDYLKAHDAVNKEKIAGKPVSAEAQQALEQAQKIHDDNKEAWMQSHKELLEEQTQFDFVAPDGPSSKYEEWLMRFPQQTSYVTDVVAGTRTKEIRPVPEGQRESTLHQSDHWSEPNVIVHLRTDERVGPDGKPFLNLIELQSDWMQAGEKHGFGVDLSKLDDQVNESRDQVYEHMEEFRKQDDKSPEAIKQYSEKLNELIDNRTKAVEARDAAVDAVEHGPFEKTWVHLGLKQLFLEAVNRGYDRIAWQPGFMQDRFQGAAEPGRAIFYDKALPQRLMDIIKKLDPSVKIESVEMDTNASADGNVMPESSVNIPSIQITPKMKEGILLSGLPLFQTKNIGTLLKENKGGVRAIRMNDGTIIAAAVDRHKLIADDQKLSPKEVQDTGLLISAGGKTYYKTGVTSGLESIFGSPEKATKSEMLPVENDKIKVIEPKQKRDSLLDFFLTQQNQAMMILLKNNKAIIKGLTNPDAESGVHELFHVVRNLLLRGDDLDLAGKRLGVEGGKWTVKNEEDFVKQYLSYIVEGKAPHPDFQKIFNTFSNEIGELYRKADMQFPKVSPELGGIFDRLLIADTDPVRIHREDLQKATDELAFGVKTRDKLRELVKNGGDTDAQMDLVNAEQGVSALRQKVEEKQVQLWKDQEEYRGPGRVNYQQDRAMRKIWDGTAEKLIPKENFQTLKDGVQHSWRWFRSVVGDGLDQLGNTPTVHKFATLLDNYAARKKSQSGQWEVGIRNLYETTDISDWKWLMQPDDRGYTRWQKLISEVGVPTKLSPEELAYADRFKDHLILFRLIHDDLAKGGQDINVLRELASGSKLLLKPSLEYRGPRLYTEDGMGVMERQGSDYQEWTAKLAKENNVTIEVATKRMQADFERSKKRTAGMLEFSRSFQNVPYTFETSDGRQINMFHTHPLEQIRAMTRVGYGRLEWIRQFGQGLLPNVFMDTVKMKRILGAFGEKVDLNKTDLTRLLGSFGMDRKAAMSLTRPEQRAQLISMGVNLEPTGDELLHRVMQLDGERFKTLPETGDGPTKAKAENHIRAIAKEVGMIDDKGPIEKLLYDLKDRLQQNTEDDLIQKIREQYGKEGGDVRDMDKKIRDAQGYPRSVLEKTPGGRVIRAATDTLYTSMLSLAALKNFPQTAAGLLKTVGVMNTWRGLLEATKSLKDTSEMLAPMGAFQYITRTYGSESSYGLLKWSGRLKDASGKIFGGDHVKELTQAWAGAAGLHTAEDFAKNGVTQKDIPLLRGELHLNEQDVSDLMNKKMSDDLRNKIIQGVQGKALDSHTPNYRKSEVQLNPWTRVLFPFIGFAFEHQRSINAMVDELRGGIKTGDHERVVGAGVQLLKHAAFTMGVGTLMGMLGNSIRSRPPVDDEDYWATVKQGFFESGMLGIGGQLFSGFNRGMAPESGSGIMISNVPALSAVSSLMDGIMGYGKYGDFGPSQRAAGVVLNNTPILKALSNAIDDLRYPEHKEYTKARASFYKWEEKQPWYDGKNFSGQLEADYDPVYQAISRFDTPNVLFTAGEFYRNRAQGGEGLSVSTQKLRSSLEARRPVPTDDFKQMLFYASLPVDRRREAFSLQNRYEGLMDLIAPQTQKKSSMYLKGTGSSSKKDE